MISLRWRFGFELMQVEYDKLFTILKTEKEIEALINPFVTAHVNDVMEQLEGQIAAAKVAMARLSSPQLYYVLSGNDFTLDINNRKEPKIVCTVNNPQKIQVYGVMLSLYICRLIKMVNKKGNVKSSLIFDEFPAIYLNNMDSLIATARSNKVATKVGVQDFSQLKKDYGKDQADAIMNITGNIFSGQVTGETAKQLPRGLGRSCRTGPAFYQPNGYLGQPFQAVRYGDPSLQNSCLEFRGVCRFLWRTIPAKKIEPKGFHGAILNDHEAQKKEHREYKSVPVVRQVTPGIVQSNYTQIKQEIEDLVNAEMERIMGDPSIAGTILKKDR